MTREQPRTLLAALIQQSDRTLGEWAQALAHAEDGMAISARHLGRLARAERDGAGQHPATRRALTAVFGHPVSKLLAPWTPTPSITPEAADVTRVCCTSR